MANRSSTSKRKARPSKGDALPKKPAGRKPSASPEETPAGDAAPGADSSRPLTSKSRAETILRELAELKSELAAENGVPDFEAPQRLLDKSDARAVEFFIRELADKKEKRKYQLSLVKEFLHDPARFGIQTEVIPSSTTPEEFEERKEELEYRIALVKTLLEMMEDELQALEKGAAYARGEGRGASS